MYTKIFHLASGLREHIINEEVSFFIVSYFSRNYMKCFFSMRETLFKLLHPNIKKYINSNIVDYFRGIDETKLLLGDFLH